MAMNTANFIAKKTQNSASCANYNANFKIFIVKFCSVWFSRNFTEQDFALRQNGARGAKF